MLAYFQVPLTWTELLKRTARETQNDNGVGLAAQLAYYSFLALFPALLFMLALVGLFPVSDLPGRLAGYLASVAPPEVATIIRDQLAQLWQSPHGGLLTFGFIAALWSSSAALVALIDTLDRQAWRELAARRALSESLLSYYLSNPASKSYCPTHIREAVKYEVGMMRIL